MSTIVGGAAQAISQIIGNPLSIINILAESLPKVKNKDKNTHSKNEIINVIVSFLSCNRLVLSLSHTFCFNL